MSKSLREEIEEAAVLHSSNIASVLQTDYHRKKHQESYRAGATAFAIRALEMAAEIVRDSYNPYPPFVELKIRKLADELRDGK